MVSKVLLIHNILWAHYRAAIFSELYKTLRENKIDLLVVHMAETEQKRVFGGDVDLSLHKYPYKVLFNTSFEELSFFPKSSKLLTELLTYSPNIVILPGYSDASYWISLIAAKAMGIKVIVTMESTEGDKSRLWFVEAIKRLFIVSCDGGFGYGRESKEYFLKLGMPEEKIFTGCQATLNEEIRVLYAAARRQRKELREIGDFCCRNFIYVGRLSREKNIATLLHAYREISSDSEVCWGLIIVGDGPERARLSRIRDELKLSKVIFLGGRSWKEVPTYYALSDVLVLPSIAEPWGLVVNEAMICGLPVLVSNRCGAAHDLVFEGRNGFVFDPRSFNELANRMKHFVENPEEGPRMGAESQKIIAAYTPENAALRMLEGIRYVLNGRSSVG